MPVNLTKYALFINEHLHARPFALQNLQKLYWNVPSHCQFSIEPAIIQVSSKNTISRTIIFLNRAVGNFNSFVNICGNISIETRITLILTSKLYKRLRFWVQKDSTLINFAVSFANSPLSSKETVLPFWRVHMVCCGLAFFTFIAWECPVSSLEPSILIFNVPIPNKVKKSS